VADERKIAKRQVLLTMVISRERRARPRGHAQGRPRRNANRLEPA
jgi:hypothetical protein